MSEMELALQRQIFDLQNQIESLRTNVVYGWNFVPLTTPLTSTSWDGDSFSTRAKTLIDLSAVFGVPAGVKAVLLNIAIRDSASAANDCILFLSAVNTANVGMVARCSGQTNDSWSSACLTVPCNANGDIFYQVVASGASTMDIYIQVHGYWI